MESQQTNIGENPIVITQVAYGRSPAFLLRFGELSWYPDGTIILNDLATKAIIFSQKVGQLHEARLKVAVFRRQQWLMYLTTSENATFTVDFTLSFAGFYGWSAALFPDKKRFASLVWWSDNLARSGVKSALAADRIIAEQKIITIIVRLIVTLALVIILIFGLMSLFIPARWETSLTTSHSTSSLF